jgi:hypothetical protein
VKFIIAKEGLMVQSLQYGDNQPSESDDASGEPFFVRRWAPEVGLHMLFVCMVYGKFFVIKL